MECIDFPTEGIDWSDKASSFQVWRTGGANARGYWYNAASGRDVNVSISVGYESSHSESTSSTETYTMGMEIKRGTEFKGTTISSEYSSSLTEATETSLTKSASATISVSCGGDGTKQIGLW